MAPAPLYGAELIDCAKANGNKGIEIASQRCGYGDVATFEQELKQACQAIGVQIAGFDDLVAPKQEKPEGVDVAPESPTQL